MATQRPMIGYGVANRNSTLKLYPKMHRNLASRHRVGIELLMVALDEVQMIKKDEAIDLFFRFSVK